MSRLPGIRAATRTGPSPPAPLPPRRGERRSRGREEAAIAGGVAVQRPWSSAWAVVTTSSLQRWRAEVHHQQDHGVCATSSARGGRGLLGTAGSPAVVPPAIGRIQRFSRGEEAESSRSGRARRPLYSARSPGQRPDDGDAVLGGDRPGVRVRVGEVGRERTAVIALIARGDLRFRTAGRC